MGKTLVFCFFLTHSVDYLPQVVANLTRPADVIVEHSVEPWNAN